MSKGRKRNWNAGLTLEQRAVANRISDEHMRAFEETSKHVERLVSRGVFGTSTLTAGRGCGFPTQEIKY